MTLRTALAGVVIVLAAAAVVGGFLVVGSPSEARFQRLDERRISDLRQIQGAVNLSWTRTKAMPESIEAALKVSARPDPIVDPATGGAYEYRVTGPTAYELCAVFDRPSPTAPSWSPDPIGSHTAGRLCFPLTVKELGK